MRQAMKRVLLSILFVLGITILMLGFGVLIGLVFPLMSQWLGNKAALLVMIGLATVMTSLIVALQNRKGKQ
jgi:hypothetical protein